MQANNNTTKDELVEKFEQYIDANVAGSINVVDSIIDDGKLKAVAIEPVDDFSDYALHFGDDLLEGEFNNRIITEAPYYGWELEEYYKDQQGDIDE
ncbi:hypothetical protein [Halorubrum sp. C191]|uniref:hypothetical protein n=1 Tax=Halorubrum sp. C191 TaxID=1383842 RepID=UPI0011817C88|nr:hypothetical protein [Halorubrum sp. C191]